MDRGALVLGGGGVAGIAWETGLIAGLTGLGVDLAAAGVIIGTSAGSVAGADTACGQELGALCQAQLAAGSRARRPDRLGLHRQAAAGRACQPGPEAGPGLRRKRRPSGPSGRLDPGQPRAGPMTIPAIPGPQQPIAVTRLQ